MIVGICQNSAQVAEQILIIQIMKIFRRTEKSMEEEWDNDICCTTCKYGYLVQDVNEGEKIHCKEKDEYMPTDGVCGDHEY